MAGYRQRQGLIFLVCSSIAVRRENARGETPPTTPVIRMKIKPTTAMGCV
ncbi:MAG: hypothetical protein V1854_03185 [Methanobacteriota archaeon]